MKIFTLILIILPLQLWAQPFRFKLTGTFSLTTPTSSTPVNFTVEWNEVNNSMKGSYRDNYFPGVTPIDGSTGTQGRVINASFPTPVDGNKSLTIMTSVTAPTSASIPLSVTVKDIEGNTKAAVNMTGILTSSDPVGTETSAGCAAGFAVLTGYCGLYAGSVQEISDSNGRCNLGDEGPQRFQLADTTDIALYFEYGGDLRGLRKHSLGKLPLSPATTSLTLNTRNCGTLFGTTFPSSNCQTMVMTGTFSELAGTQTFRGNYTMTDEITGENCSYSLDMIKEL